ncbi:MAG: GAF domain-containing protein [Deltaproteobacteria bacterium]|nr:MAG: GAF domain-containing protein [Deltaproteobacteria bacterium]
MRRLACAPPTSQPRAGARIRGDMLRTAAEVAAAIRDDPRCSAWSVVDAGPDFVEVDLGDVHTTLAWPPMWTDPARLRPHLVRARADACPLVFVGTPEQLAAGRVDALDDPPTNRAAAVPMSPEQLVALLRSQAAIWQRARRAAQRDVQLERARYEVDLLISVGRALAQQRDIDSLLEAILSRAREVTGADAGSVYAVENIEDDDASNDTVRFRVAQNDSVAVDETRQVTLPVSASSIVGACVLSRDVINIPDLYALGPPGSPSNPWGLRHDRSFDEKYGYQTRSMLAVPMISARDQVIGVIQLINKRAKGVARLATAEDFATKVVPFDEASVELAVALAAQAGIALENALLYDEVRTLFEGFVHASVTAIEARDPTTSGHSQRVADLTVGLAKVVDRCDRGPYADLRFSYDEIKQIEYASLLHDFGKVGVREHVLVKAKKLYAHEEELVRQRFNFIRKAIEAEQLERKVRYLLEASRDRAAEQLEAIDRDARAKLTEIDEFLQFILAANEPTVLERGGFERIADIARRTYRDVDGSERPYLTEREAMALQIPRGSLTPEERKAIEEHVVHTYNFLVQIPWGRTYRDIPAIAGAHHEKLDGSGYPRGVSDIAPPARMMTISDIFDALTASDRPYKRAVPVDKALDILGYEVEAGKLDGALLELFIDAKVYELAFSK